MRLFVVDLSRFDNSLEGVFNEVLLREGVIILEANYKSSNH